MYFYPAYLAVRNKRYTRAEEDGKKRIMYENETSV